MLAEIFMLRLEAAARVVKFEAATPSRFVPITLPAAKAFPSFSRETASKTESAMKIGAIGSF